MVWCGVCVCVCAPRMAQDAAAARAVPGATLCSCLCVAAGLQLRELSRVHHHYHRGHCQRVCVGAPPDGVDQILGAGQARVRSSWILYFTYFISIRWSFILFIYFILFDVNVAKWPKSQ